MEEKKSKPDTVLNNDNSSVIMKEGNNKSTIYIAVGVVVAIVAVCCIISACAIAIFAIGKDVERKEEERQEQEERDNDVNGGDEDEDEDEGEGEIKATSTPVPTTTSEGLSTREKAALDKAKFTFPRAKTTIDDDPVLGTENAKVVIVEYTDYECPFCQRHHEQTHPQILENYINTQKVIMVVRDFPLSFHDPAATQKALAAECVHHLGSDEDYYEYADELFGLTASSSHQVSDSTLRSLAEKVGIDGDKFESCLDNKTYQTEINEDQADGTKAGVSGTPGFIVGYLGANGEVDGFRIDGAYPYDKFEEVIDYLLSAAE